MVIFIVRQGFISNIWASVESSEIGRNSLFDLAMKDKGGVCEYSFCHSILFGNPSDKKVCNFKEIQRQLRILCLRLCFQALLDVKIYAAVVSVCVMVGLFDTRETANVYPELRAAAGVFSKQECFILPFSTLTRRHWPLVPFSFRCMGGPSAVWKLELWVRIQAAELLLCTDGWAWGANVYSPLEHLQCTVMKKLRCTLSRPQVTPLFLHRSN